ncbi:MAG: pyridoxamine 5'-phosphate oxidase [Chloroflexaceae bacterium]|nr:pyridoxamine 5'-phosphate oxidase [Chloroflexaceae bacterium]
MDISIADLRQNYSRARLDETSAAADPILQFQAWLEAAVAARLPEPNAMMLATVTPEGKPAARMVLLKEFDEMGFIFYTNYQSHKGQQLQANPQAALVFWWAELERQVRIEGSVEQVPPEMAIAYFHSRPRESQLGAWASPQSQVIPQREVLDRRLEDLKQEYKGREIPRPPHWGGFRVVPQRLEFWQGRPSRLHDRLCYRLNGQNQWILERLAP